MEVRIGIDPGKKGGFAAIFPNSDVIVFQWDDTSFVSAMKVLSREYDCKACVEKVGAMPGQGVASMFSFGKSCGYIEGVLTAYGIPYQLVPPVKWKKEFSLNSNKDLSIYVCKKLFPNVSLRPTDRCRKDSDGMAEALLMAEYARRHL